jgi:hypothetical protein
MLNPPAQLADEVHDFSLFASRNTDLAQEVQRPQPALTPSPSFRSRIERAPSSTAWRISLSVTALHMQTYMTFIEESC